MTASSVAKANPLITIIHLQSRLLVSRTHSHSHSHNSNLPRTSTLGEFRNASLSIDVPRECLPGSRVRERTPGPFLVRDKLYSVYILTYGRDSKALICMVRSLLLIVLQPPTILRCVVCEIHLIVHDYSTVICARLATHRNMTDTLDILVREQCRGSRDGKRL
jgi:hypothetical protein